MGLDVPFPYPYGSDLHWLWGWSHRIDLMLCREGYIPGSHDWMIFRPSEPADDAMMRYSIDYPAVIADVRERLAATEAAFEKLIENPTEQTEFVFADRVEVLESRIKKACELIAERESTATNPAAVPKSAVRSRHISWDDRALDDTIVEDLAGVEESGLKRNAKWSKVHALLDNETDSDGWDYNKRRQKVTEWNEKYSVGLTVKKLGELIRSRRKQRPKSDD